MGDGSAASVETGHVVICTCWLPVDGLHAVFEVSRGLELPIANDGPEDEDTPDGSSDSSAAYEGGFSEIGRRGRHYCRTSG